MDDFARARQMMVDGQLRINDVTDPRLLAAILDIPRERFVPREKAPLAYLDCDLDVLPPGPERPARHLLKPLVLAKLIDIAEVQPTDRVLDVGCATGYSTAVLARLAAEVVAVEEETRLAEAAAANLKALKATNATVRTGALTAGAADLGPFDGIFLNGAVEVLPDSLTAQLSDGGRLVCVMREGPVGRGMIFRSSSGHLSGRSIFDSNAPILPGFARPPAFVF